MLKGSFCRRSHPRRLRVVAGTAAVTTAALALAACSSSGSAPAAATGSTGSTGPYSVSVLVSGVSFSALPVYAMQDPALEAQTGVKVTLAPFNSGGGSTSQVFAGGTGDVLYAGIDGVVPLAKDIKVTVIGTESQYAFQTLVSKAGSQYKTPADLKGATIAVSGPGSFSDYLTRDYLIKNGVHPDTDVKIAGLGSPAVQLAGLVSGKVQAATLNGPTTQIARNAGQTQVIYRYEDEGKLPSVLFTGRQDDVKADPNKFAAFMKAFVAAVQKLKSDPDYAMKLAKSKFPATSDKITKEELNEFLVDPGVWSQDGLFTDQLYTKGKNMLIGSQKFTADGFPTYANLTTGAPSF